MLGTASYFTLSQRKKERKGDGIRVKADVCVAIDMACTASSTLIRPRADLDLKARQCRGKLDFIGSRQAACAVCLPVGGNEFVGYIDAFTFSAVIV